VKQQCCYQSLKLSLPLTISRSGRMKLRNLRMSISIHTPPLAKFDTIALDQQAISNNKSVVNSNAQSLGATSFKTPMRPYDLDDLGDTVFPPQRGLGQLFDMLESIFGAIRDLFSGNHMIRPDSGDLRNLPQPGDFPVMVPGGNRRRSMPFPATVPRPEISVNDPRAKVHVNVVVSDWRSDDARVPPNRVPALKVSTDTRPQPLLVPGNLPKPSGQMNSHSLPGVLPHNRPVPRPDGSTPDLTSPGPADGQFAGRQGRFNHRLSSRF